MKFHLTNLGDTKLFTAHGADHVMVSGVRYGNGVVVLADEVRNDWNATRFDELSEAHFTYFLALKPLALKPLALKPEILLLGTGAKQRFPHPRLYRALTDAHIALESMDTPAACRTYNILVAEDRRVVAAILL